MKCDANETKILESVERGEWRSVKGASRDRSRYVRYARATFKTKTATARVRGGMGGRPRKRLHT